jgi:hypothetical protein
MRDYHELLQPRTAKVKQDASFLRRAFAFIFDLLVIDIIVAAPFAPVFKGMMARAEHGAWGTIVATNKELGAAMLLFLIIYLYFVLFEYLIGQTLGMILLDIKVEGDTGIFAILVRNCFILPVFPFIAFWIIEPIAIIIWRRGALEFLSRTRTLYHRKVFV